MKLLFLLLGFVVGGETIQAESLNFFLGTHRDIFTCSLNTETGLMTTPSLVAKAPGPTFLALSPDQKFLYAELSGHSVNPTAVSAYSVGDKLQLTLINTVTGSGNGACHIAVDATGSQVLVANYQTGDIFSLARHPDGSLGDETAHLVFQGHGPYASRQSAPHLHMVCFDPQNQYLYCCDLGTDKIWSFKFTPSTGALVATHPPSANVPPGSGCRHIAFSSDGRFAYVSNEMALTVSVFARNEINGTLDLLQTVPMLPKGVPPEPNTAAEVVVHPNGHYLYVSNRTCDTICYFRIAADGTLESLKTVAAGVRFPRNIAIDPSGHWLIAAGEKSDTLTAFRLDPTTGDLTPTGQTVNVSAPTCILFLKQPAAPGLLVK